MDLDARVAAYIAALGTEGRAHVLDFVTKYTVQRNLHEPSTLTVTIVLDDTFAPAGDGPDWIIDGDGERWQRDGTRYVLRSIRLTRIRILDLFGITSEGSE